MSEYSILVEKEKMRSMLKEKLDELFDEIGANPGRKS